jgi:hypothetical protein
MKYKLDVYCLWDLNLDVWLNQPCELFVDVIPDTKENKNRILWVIEPNEITGFRDEIIKKHNYFNLILTWDEYIISSCKNAKLFPFGGSWVKDYNFNKKKQFLITTLVGGKNLVPNHTLRQLIPKIQDKITSIELDVFNSVNNPYISSKPFKQIQDKLYKNELFYGQFHLCIENVTRNNWFTEKIIDCFQTKTIPIYIGCPNIGDFFDTNGIIHVKDIDELISECNKLTPEYYNSKLESIEKNYELSHKYADYQGTLISEIKNYVNSIN